MQKKSFKKHLLKKQEGAVAVIVAVCMVTLIGMAALAIDVGYLYATKNELQNISDAAALAGVVALRDIYLEEVIPEGKENFICDEPCKAKIIGEIIAVTNKNISNDLLPGDIIADSDINVGRWDSDINIFTPDTTLPNAVQVKAARRYDKNSVSLFFANIFSISETNVASNESVASLTGSSEMIEPEVTTPFAVSQLMFPDHCVETVQFRPSASCGGWHNYVWHASSSDINTHALGTIYRHVYDGDRDLTSGKEWLEENFNIKHLEKEMEKLYNVNNVDDINLDPYKVGDEFNFIGGVSSTHFSNHYVDPNSYDGNTSDNTLNSSGKVANNPNNPAPMFALFDYFRYRDGDDDDSTWSAYVPVYEESGTSISDCSNPNDSKKIVGFAKATVILPKGPPYSEIDVNIECSYQFSENSGSGITVGPNVLGTIPKLVK